MDQVEQLETLTDLHSDYQVQISAKMAWGLDELKDILEMILRNRKIYLKGIFLPGGWTHPDDPHTVSFLKKSTGRMAFTWRRMCRRSLRRADALTADDRLRYGSRIYVPSNELPWLP